MPGATAADLLVGRVRGGAAGVADGGDPDPGRLPEHPLGAPEAAEREYRLLQPRGIGSDQRMAVDEVPFRHRHRLGPSRQTFPGPGNDQLVTR